MESTATAFAGLTPSQAIRSVSSNAVAPTSKAGNSNTYKSGRQRQRNKKKRVGDTTSSSPQNVAQTDEKEAAPSTEANANAVEKKGRRKRRPRKKKANNNSGEEKGADSNGIAAESNNKNSNYANNKTTRKKSKQIIRARQNNADKKFPWRKLIPAGTVDPITLEDLASLHYPPFALRAADPYLIPDWPPREKSEDFSQNDANKKEVDAKERERRLLAEQWGSTVLSSPDEEKKTSAQVEADVNPSHLNLFDGRALAYYMVSTTNFIDPLCRRDLSREELVHLDRYLARHGFTDLNVVEAYDTKGVSLSTAGSASTTAAGRMEILQQEARVLLNALFGGGPSTPAAPSSRNNNNRNSLLQQYSNYQAAQEQEHQQHQRGQQSNHLGENRTGGYFVDGVDNNNSTGVYGDESGGMMVIDDDLNPSMRGSATRGLRPYRGLNQPTQNANSMLWSANRATDQHGESSPSLQAHHFPALAATATIPADHSPLNSSAPTFVPGGGLAMATTVATPQAAPKSNNSNNNNNKKPLPPASSLKFITKAVKKTKPEEAQRQFEAREEARKKAMLSNLTFGSNPASWDGPSTAPAAPATHTPTQGQLERNQAFANALGVSSSTAASQLQQGWARPTNPGGGNNVTVYPDALILTAREKMGILLKLERKWKVFLEDDKAASLPLNKMNCGTRKFTHEYAEFFKMKTESFDPEPNRYIHCVKLLDTSAPYPLLSEAAKNWRGPTIATTPSLEHSSQQTAGQDTRGGLEVDLNPRAAPLGLPERPKLDLKERTLPLELPPFQPPPLAAGALDEESEEQRRRRQAKIVEQKQKEQERKDRKQQILEAAFASDSEEESLGEVDADSDWEEAEELYSGSNSDVEEM